MSGGHDNTLRSETAHRIVGYHGRNAIARLYLHADVNAGLRRDQQRLRPRGDVEGVPYPLRTVYVDDEPGVCVRQ